jgi:RNA polymerase sigma-70 factor (ECF subfamily)
MSDVGSPSITEALRTLSERRDDPCAWEEIYARYWRFVLSIASRFTHDFALAEDLAQEVFLRIARYCPFEKFSDERLFRSYVGTVAVNRVMDDLQTRAARQRRLDLPLEAAAHVPVSDDVAAQAELRDTMSWLMGQLAPFEADLVHKLAKGLSMREIASGTADPYGTVAVRVHRLRRRLVGLRRKM